MGDWPSKKTSAGAETLGQLEDAWAKFNKSWKSDADLTELGGSMKKLFPVAQAEGLEGELHNSLSSFIHEVGNNHLDHAPCRALAEELTELSIKIDNRWANAAINTLVFSIFFEQTDFKGAEPWLERSIEMNNGSESENSLNNLGICYAMTGKESLALAIFVRAVSIGSSGYKPEALYYLVHILSRCNSTAWSRDCLGWIAQSADSSYRDKALRCLRGDCSSDLKTSFGMKKYELLSATSESYGEILARLHTSMMDKWDSEIPLEESLSPLEDFESPKLALGRILESNGIEPQLLEFCAQVNIGHFLVSSVVLSLTLESGLEPCFSTFGSELVSLWHQGETKLILGGLAQECFLGQPEFDPKLHQSVNFAIHETLIRTIRTGQGYVTYASDLVCWEASLESALESKYLNALVEQRQEGNLQNFSWLLEDAKPSEEEPKVVLYLRLAALSMLEILENWEGGAAIWDISSEWYSRLSSSPDIANHEVAISGLHEFLEQRFAFVRGDVFNSRDIEFSIPDTDFLSHCLLMLAANNASAVFEDCLFAVSNALVSPSLQPKVAEIATMAWLNGATYNPLDERLALFPTLVSIMFESKSIREAYMLATNRNLDSILNSKDCLALRLARGSATREEMLDYLESSNPRGLRDVAHVRGLADEVYLGILDRLGDSVVPTLALNPDGFDAVEPKCGSRISSDRELSYACAKAFVQSTDSDWPRNLPRILTEAENKEALLLLARDPRLSDALLQKIASKANKQIATALNENPKASDETRALAQLVA